MIDNRILIIGILTGFILGVILTSIAIGLFTIGMFSSIPPGIIENVNMTVDFNETELFNLANESGLFER